MAGRKPTVSDEEILSVIERAEAPVVSTSDVANEVGLSNPGAYKRLKQLEQEGKVNSQDVGDALAWYLPDYSTGHQ